jgi:hypothetical protein
MFAAWMRSAACCDCACGLVGEEGPSVAQAANIDSAADMKTMCAERLILTM